MLSIIVLSWDAPDMTRRCVASIRDNTTGPFELIIVDNGSAPSVQELVRSLSDVSILNDRNLGFAAGMNRGLEAARGQLVAFVNNDAVLPRRWNAKLAEHLASQDVGMCVPAVTAAGNVLTVRDRAGREVRRLRPFEEIPSAVVVLMRAEDCRNLGGWDERYFPASAEDAELAFAIWVNGLDIVFDSRVLVDHVGKATTREKFPRWRQIWHENGLLFLRRWASGQAVPPRLPHCSPEDWQVRRRGAATAAARELGRSRRLDRWPRRLARNVLLPHVERWRVARRSRGHGMRRLVYLSLHASAPGQGAHTHIYETTSRLRGRGWDVRLEAPGALPVTASLFRRITYMFAVQLRVIASWQPVDAVYVRYHPASVLITLWTLVTRTRRIEEVNGPLDDWYAVHPSTRFIAPLLRACTRLNLRTASCVLAVSEGLAQWCAQQGVAGDVTVVANGVDVDLFRPLGPQARAPRTAVFAGALTPWSGIETAIAATEDAAWPDDWLLVVAGGGKLRDRVERAADLSPRVSYLGPLPYREVPSLLAHASIVLSPNVRVGAVGSPLKLYEAMSVGRPVIASSVAGQAEIVAGSDCGLLIPPSDPSALAAAVRKLADDPAARERFGRNGRVAAAGHSWEAVVTEIERVLADRDEG